MIDLTMWVLHRSGEVMRDNEGFLLFDTCEQARVYWECCVLEDYKGWKPKKVKVTDAK